MTSHVLVGLVGAAVGAMVIVLLMIIGISAGGWIGHDGYRYKIERGECARQPCAPVSR